jgi:glyoxylase-like metal-dependent hydrolase (beta-lactamase superfamily II)
MKESSDIRTFSLRYTNCFLLPHGNRWLLIDTGYEREWEAFSRGLASFGVGPRDLSHLLLTHAHDDHAGLLGRMAEENPELSILMSEKAPSILEGGSNRTDGKGGYVTRRMRSLAGIKAAFDKNWTHRFPPYSPRPEDRAIAGSARLRDLGIGLDGTIYPTPGHTDDSVSLVMDDGTCYCGDAAANFFRFAGTRKCVIYVRDIGEYYRSWDRLLGAGAKIMYPSHGWPFPSELLTKERGRHKRVFA